MPSPSSPISPIVASNTAKRTWPTARPNVLAITQRSQSALPPDPSTVAAVPMRAFCTAGPQFGTRRRRLRLPNERTEALGPSHASHTRQLRAHDGAVSGSAIHDERAADRGHAVLQADET